MTERSIGQVPQGGGASAPAATISDDQIGGQTIGDREVHTGTAPKRRERREPIAPAALPDIIERLVRLQRERKFCIATQSKLERSTEAFIVRLLGYSPDLPDAQRKALWKQASAIRKEAEGGGGESHKIHAGQPGQSRIALSASRRLILQAASSRAPWDELRGAIEFEMEGLAKQTPVWAWVQGIKGFGPKGLAIIIAEAGADLGNYPTREKLWKRLGLAVMDGKRQGAPGKSATAQDWLDHGYSKQRRSEIWTVVDSLFKHQWAGAKDEDGKNPVKSGKPVAVPAHATGPYGEVYAARKDRTADSESIATPKHRDNDARRIMTKALIEDLWRVWAGRQPRMRVGTAAAAEPLREAA